MKKSVTYNLFILLITILQVLESRRLTEFTGEEKECLKQLNADERKIGNQYFRYATPEDDAQFNNFIRCVWVKLEFLDKNENIDYEKLKYHYRIGLIHFNVEKFVFDAIVKCESNHNSLKADTPAKTAVKVQNCIFNNFFNATRLYYPTGLP
ncbi:hypothetical protein ILUMI_11466 [Ignelater luminosus]|uniref:Uncharacterized protein n=1 Tax=Ignelater luminosus TaxID=2038154 RepID=A0A8K0GD79_IGNLU|nr:hypothetical protein ILUMI_11466 [Ignelater luminosus]